MFLNKTALNLDGANGWKKIGPIIIVITNYDLFVN